MPDLPNERSPGLSATLDAAHNALTPEEIERTSNLWRKPMVWPGLNLEKRSPSVVKVAGFVRLETTKFRVQLYEFQYPWEPHNDPRTGLPVPSERADTIEARCCNELESTRQVPSRWDATEWLLSQYDNPVDDVQHLHDACGLHYRGEHHQYWYGYRDLRAGSVGYGFADRAVLESLIWMAKTQSQIDRDRLHELLLAPMLNDGPMDRYSFLMCPPPVFTAFADE